MQDPSYWWLEKSPLRGVLLSESHSRSSHLTRSSTDVDRGYQSSGHWPLLQSTQWQQSSHSTCRQPRNEVKKFDLFFFLANVYQLCHWKGWTIDFILIFCVERTGLCSLQLCFNHPPFCLQRHTPDVRTYFCNNNLH